MSYKDWPVRIVDVSSAQDNPATEKKPDIKLLLAAGIFVIAVRVGLGIVIDRAFKWFWTTARGLMQRKPYWYGDYYSHRHAPLAVKKISDYHWGEMQADACYDFLAGDFGESALVWDGEQSPSGWPIDIFNKRYYNQVLKGFYDRWLSLTGKKIEIYASPGFLWVFDDWVRDLTLWVAWYNRALTRDQVIAECRKKGWRGPILIWQYTSDGDFNDDGKADGLLLGMESKTLDYNVFMGTLEEWSAYCGNGSIPSIPQPEDPVPPVIPTPTKTITVGVMKVLAPDGLNIRNVPIGENGTAVTGWSPKDTELPILETKVIGDNIWARVGQKQWSAIKYGGTTFLELGAA